MPINHVCHSYRHGLLYGQDLQVFETLERGPTKRVCRQASLRVASLRQARSVSRLETAGYECLAIGTSNAMGLSFTISSSQNLPDFPNSVCFHRSGHRKRDRSEAASYTWPKRSAPALGPHWFPILPQLLPATCHKPAVANERSSRTPEDLLAMRHACGLNLCIFNAG